MEALQRVKLEGFAPAIAELETELEYLRRARRYMGIWKSDRPWRRGCMIVAL
jgi:hypothetical protein